MSENGLNAAQKKMRDAGVAQQAIDVFSHYYRELENGATGLIPEDSIEPLTQIDSLDSVSVSPEQARDALSKTVLIKLNGGLGTSMGMDKAKSLLPVRDGKTFLDLIVGQVKAARVKYGVTLPLIFMNSFRTRCDTLEALAAHPGIEVEGLPLDFLQNREPKLRADDLTPVTWEADPELEWCPPGHGDIYTALVASGVLDALLERGYRYAMTSNSDNLGAAPSALIAGWFAASGAPYAPEMCRRTPADVKGGHLAVRKSDGRIILRDTAQTPAEEMHYFTDQFRHPFFHTNNLWFDLQVLRDTLVQRDGILGLPLIKNAKTVDPSDSSSTPVIQMETAMGAAVEAFEGATAIEVPRSRFLPVKTTNDLLLVRSDVYELDEDGLLQMAADQACTVNLDTRYYKKIKDFEARFPAGVPSIRHARTFRVEGDWTFGRGVVATADAVVSQDGAPGTIADGTQL
ncbi:MAG: UTP--glucose-1-phosphate uridylyltransferase [Actinomyces urogenitalis]|uniref:UTP--glucose-1-phosphate uridylyltransferase n=1 Tax=Actinomyces urogenitalis TaxID=103621 RepID=A0A2I1KV79_9ACTO|nr:UTP--glucose-1-phosphate uridylyltransferase [Actinomyces urogenitalis]MBS5976181.1 UTP--glucose-1-phosphate uridylyltransferase [Actinomyces urogenitalis]MDU0863400.1 UTP--glucose-1-phosphate uridylyltransferase [Actinomyces urogenitalis]MDU0873825.1 UTP--glucose-1-phosphate uridylyltransferase [Actinomyces urogenitalis]MDU0971462.1 UTP--glucose-1-phosphate uridylyltransferase [Actinomyces urogenitalis]MDU1563539.1 UTP--glucose-1-phosphate uridylyltransferase [Actinomyces urogenitalis]